MCLTSTGLTVRKDGTVVSLEYIRNNKRGRIVVDAHLGCAVVVTQIESELLGRLLHVRLLDKNFTTL